MTALTLDAARIGELLQELLDGLEGDWLLVGGALVAAWLDEERRTEDLDIVGLRGTPDERFKLLDLVCRMGIPVEVVNSAADYFVYRIAGWREQIEILMRGPRSVLYRPTPTLFLMLKASRLSERDLRDCRLMLDRCARDNLPVDVERVRTELALRSPGTGLGATDRQQTLRRWLEDITRAST